MTKSYDVFVCHNSKDAAEVRRIVDTLESRGVRCWIDIDELTAGTRWLDFIKTDWPRIGAMAILYGPHGIGPAQAQEIAHLVPLADAAQEPVIPVVLTSVAPVLTADAVIPGAMTDRVYIDLRDTTTDPYLRLEEGIKGRDPSQLSTIGALYRDTHGLTGPAFAAALGRIASQGHKRMSYLPEVRRQVETLFEDPGNPDNVILLPDAVSVPKKAYGPSGARAGADVSWNLDHIWPKAFGWGDHATARADLHNIIPANAARNARRGAGRFYSDVFDTLHAELERGDLLTPNPVIETRGIVARACLYMVVRYRGLDGDPCLELDEQVPVIGEPHLSSLTTMLHWNKMHPPTTEERRRNVRIADLQGNRNPFVDSPDFADRVWRLV